MIGKPTGKQRRSIVRSTRRLNVWHGSVSSGKTVASIVAWLAYCAEGPAGDLLMLGKTERTLERNVLNVIADAVGGEYEMRRGIGEAVIFGRRVYLAGASDERAEAKIRGLTVAGAYGDELTTWPESVFKMLLSRLRVKGARLYGTTNPDAPLHWLKRDYLDREDELDLAAFHFELRDNPFLDEAYLAALELEYTGLWRKRFIDGLWVLAEGAVYDAFDVDRHVVDELPEIDEYVLCLDYGTSNPTHALLLGLGSDERLYVCREWVWNPVVKRRALTDTQLSEGLALWLDTGADELCVVDGRSVAVPIADVVIDPSAASMRRQLAADGWGWPTSADNAVLDGIRETAALIASDRLRVHRSCEVLTKQLSGYVWDATKQKRGEDAPLKKDDHGPDALRYGVRWSRHWWRSWVVTARDDDEMQEAA